MRSLALMVGVALSISCSPEDPALIVTAIEPAWTIAGTETAVIINGTFNRLVHVSYKDSSQSTVDSTFSASLGTVALQRVTMLSEQVLSATVPLDLPEGTHDLVVIDPHRHRIEVTGAFQSVVNECELDGTTEGQPCDDNDPCTANDGCASGACAGTFVDTDGDGTCDSFDPDDDDDGCDDDVDSDPLVAPTRAYRSLHLLFVAQDTNTFGGDVDLSASDQAMVDLFENAGHTVALFEPTTSGCLPANDNQAVFDAALAADTFDAVFVSNSCETINLVDGDTADPTAPSYLNDAAIGVLFNDDALIDNMFFADNHGADQASEITLIDNTSFVSSFLPSTGSITLLSSFTDAAIGWTDNAGALAPDLQSLARAPSGATHESFLLVEAGADLLYGTVAPARRLSLPAVRADRWTAFADTLTLRALLWVAGEDSTLPLLDADDLPAHCDPEPDVFTP